MQAPDVVRFSLRAIRAEPWRNRGGVTRVISSGAFQGGAHGFDYRLSVADITANGPFSMFHGIDRLSLLLEGETLTLFHDGMEKRSAALMEAIQYDGALPLHAYIGDIPARCLNVMTRKGAATASLRVLDGINAIPAADLCMILSLKDSCMVIPDGSQKSHMLDRYEGLLLRRTSCVLRPANPTEAETAVIATIVPTTAVTASM